MTKEAFLSEVARIKQPFDTEIESLENKLSELENSDASEKEINTVAKDIDKLTNERFNATYQTVQDYLKTVCIDAVLQPISKKSLVKRNNEFFLVHNLAYDFVNDIPELRCYKVISASKLNKDLVSITDFQNCDVVAQGVPKNYKEL